MHTSAPDRSPDPIIVSVDVHRHPTRNHRHARPLLRAQQCCLFTLLSAKYCCVTKETQQCYIHCCSSANVVEPREPHTCNIAPSLRLLVPSSLQVLRPSADANRHHLRSKMPLDPVGMIRRFWRAFIR
jgi:hypothetical protein